MCRRRTRSCSCGPSGSSCWPAISRTAQPVLDIEARIAELQAYVAAGTTVGAKEVRTGPNPVWTELETTRITTQAERDALAARLSSLNRQLAEILERQAQLTRDGIRRTPPWPRTATC